jgi:hypothetical protein
MDLFGLSEEIVGPISFKGAKLAPAVLTELTELNR